MRPSTDAALGVRAWKTRHVRLRLIALARRDQVFDVVRHCPEANGQLCEEHSLLQVLAEVADDLAILGFKAIFLKLGMKILHGRSLQIRLKSGWERDWSLGRR